MTKYIDQHRDVFGVEPICQVLEIAPSTYYAAKTRPPSARAIRDAELKPKISEVHEENFEVYGVRKVWRQLHRDDVEVGRDRVGRLMGELGLCGATRTKRVRTTYPAPVSDRPADLVERVFTASAPDQLWVADSPMSGPEPASATPPSSSMPSAAASWAGGSPPRCAPTLPSTPSRWPSGAGVTGPSPG